MVLTRERVRNYSAVFLVGWVVAVLGTSLVLALRPGGAASVSPDFLAHWTGGRMVLDGALGSLYDPVAQHRLQAELGAAPDTLAWFVSPPFVAVLYAPFALLPYLVAALLWAVTTATLLWWSLRRLGTFGPALWARERGLVVLVTLASYPLLELVGDGQDSAVGLAIWVGGIGLALRGRDTAAGLVLALGVYKPQLVFLVPLVALAQQRWRLLGSFVLGSAALGLASAALVGTAGLRAWAAALGSPLYEQQVTFGQAWKMASVPALTTSLAEPLGHGVATIAGYAAMAGLVAAFAVWIWRRRPAPVVAWTAAMGMTVAASPHVVVYDAVLIAPVAVMLLDRNVRGAASTVAATFVVAFSAAPIHVLRERSSWLPGWTEAPWVAVGVLTMCLLLRRAESLATDSGEHLRRGGDVDREDVDAPVPLRQQPD